MRSGCRAPGAWDIVGPGRARRRAGRAKLINVLAPMDSILLLIDTVINLFVWAVIIHIVLTWLVSFNVVNTRNRFVYIVGNFLYRLTEPVLRPIRQVMPNFGGIDISPIVLILGLWFVNNLLHEYLR